MANDDEKKTDVVGYEGTKTPIYGFNLPTPGADEDTWGLQLNQNWSNLDNYLSAKAQRVDAHLEGEPTAPEPLDVTTPSNRIANMASVIKAVFANVFWDKIQGKPATYPPPIASASGLGGVKIGKSIKIAADGTIDTVSGEGEVLPGKKYQVPVYDNDGNIIGPAVGGFTFYNGSLSLGDNTHEGTIYLAENSGGAITLAPTVNAKTKWTFRFPDGPGANGQFLGWMNGPAWIVPPALQPATTTQLGGIKIGGSFSITSGGSLELRQALASQLGGVKVSNDDDGIDISPDGTITVHRASKIQYGGLKLGAHLEQRGTDGTVDVVIPPATTETLGGVIAGSGISITPEGRISVSGSSATSVENMFVFDAPGTFDFKPNGDTTQAKITLIGGGGGGGDACDFCGGGGGGAGGFIQAVVIVRPGDTFKVIVGAGGASSASLGNGGTGGESSFTIVNSKGETHKILTASGGSGGKKGSSTDDLPADGGAGGFPWVFTDAFYVQRGSDWGARGGEGGLGLNYVSTKWPHNNGRFRIPGMGGISGLSGSSTLTNAEGYGSGGPGGTDRLNALIGKAGRQGICIIEYDGTPVSREPLPPQLVRVDTTVDGAAVVFTPPATVGNHDAAVSFYAEINDLMAKTKNTIKLETLPAGDLKAPLPLLAGRIYDIRLAGENDYGKSDWSPAQRVEMPGFPFALELIGNNNGGAAFNLNGFGLNYDEHVASVTFTAKDGAGKVIDTVNKAGSGAAFYDLGHNWANDKCLPWARNGYYPIETKQIAGLRYVSVGYEKPELPYGAGTVSCDVTLVDGRKATLGPVNFNNDPYIPFGAYSPVTAEIKDGFFNFISKKIILPMDGATVTKVYAVIRYWRMADGKRIDKYVFEWCTFKSDDLNTLVNVPLNYPSADAWLLDMTVSAQIKGKDGALYVTSASSVMTNKDNFNVPPLPLDTPVVSNIRWYKSSRPCFVVNCTYNLTPNPNTHCYAEGAWVSIYSAQTGFIYAVQKNTADSGPLTGECMTKDTNIPSGTVLKARLYSSNGGQLAWVDIPDTYTVP